MTDVEILKRYFLTKYIKVPDLWVNACLEYVYTEYPNKPRGASNNWVKDAVYEQWLHCDLTQLGSNALPSGIAREKCVKINGNFPLQMNKIENIGSSSYSQMKSILKQDSENHKVMEDKPQNFWEPKPTRTLWLELTDGTSVVKGIEHESLPALNVNMKPGTKVLVSGSLVVRRGVIFLSPKNVKVLGGYIVDLEVSNALQNVLARNLGQEETDNPRSIEIKPEAPPTQSSQYYPSQVTSQKYNVNTISVSMPAASKKQSTICMDDLDDNDFLDSEMEEALSIAENSQPSNFLIPEMPSFQSTNQSYSNNKTFNTKKSQPLNTQSSRLKNTFSHPLSRPNSTNQSYSLNSTSSSSQHQNDDPFDDDLNDDLFLSIPAHEINPTNMNTNTSQIQLDTDDDDLFLQIEPQIENNTFSRNASQNKNHKVKNSTQSSSTKCRPQEYVKELPPFNYLMFVPENPTKEEKFVIKGFVMTLLSKLEQSEGQWKLMAKINDGTKSQVVQIHDNVLSRLIGMTVSELCQKKSNAKGNKQELDAIVKSVMSCQQKLISLCGLLQITVTPTSKHPFMMDFKEISSETAAELENRVGKYNY